MPPVVAKIKLVPGFGYVGQRRQFFDMLCTAVENCRAVLGGRSVAVNQRNAPPLTSYLARYQQDGQGVHMAKAVYQRSVEMAAEILGSNDAVAGYLGVNPAEVLSWVEGRAEPAINLFLRLVDLIEKNTVSAARTATVVRSKRDERG
jgi:hypothetical protein